VAYTIDEGDNMNIVELTFYRKLDNAKIMAQDILTKNI